MGEILPFVMAVDRAVKSGTYPDLAKWTAAKILAAIEASDVDLVVDSILSGIMTWAAKGLLDRGIPQMCARSIASDVEELADLGQDDEDEPQDVPQEPDVAAVVNALVDKITDKIDSLDPDEEIDEASPLKKRRRAAKMDRNGS